MALLLQAPNPQKERGTSVDSKTHLDELAGFPASSSAHLLDDQDGLGKSADWLNGETVTVIIPARNEAIKSEKK